jgi:nucleoside-diphosphate-sugar epimerase
MRVLVTGATGFIGNHVVTALLAGGHDVVVCTRNPEKARAFTWYPDVTCITAAVGKPDASLFERAGAPSVLIHAAWDRLDNYRDPSHVDAQLAEHYEFIRGLVGAGLGQCLVLGTCLEYGLQEGALSEDMQAKPILAYPQAKDKLRQLLAALQTEHHFTLQWVRLFYLYGQGQRPTSLLAQLDTALDTGKDSFDMSPGDQLRDYLPVSDVAKIVCKIAERREFDGIVNCCSGHPVSVLDLVRQRLRERGATLTLNTGKYPYPNYEPRNFWGDRARLDALLG